MPKMRAVMICPGPSGGAPEVREVEQPQIANDQVLVRVHGSALNRGELTAVLGLKSGSAVPHGAEFAGEIVAMGANVDGWRVGDRVMGQGRGTMAEYVAVDQRALMGIPDSLSYTDAAAFPNVFITVHNALVTNGRLRSGETVLINAASSGVGTAAIQVARLFGAGQIIGTSRSRAKLDAVAQLGLSLGIPTDEENFVEAVKKATDGRGVDLIIDSLGGPVLPENLRAMAILGRLICVGRTAGALAELDFELLCYKRLSLMGVSFRMRTTEEILACSEAAARDLMDPLSRGELKPVVDSIFPMTEIAEAHARMRSNEHVGKIVVTIE